MQQQNEEIRRNSQKFVRNSYKFVRISHCLNIHRNSFGRNLRDARRHWVEVPSLRDSFGEVGVELLEERPPHPRPQVALALLTPGELRILGRIFTPRGVEKQLKIF